MSLPLPPYSLSFPLSPYSVSFPMSPLMMSLPSYPWIILLRLSPVMTSFPFDCVDKWLIRLVKSAWLLGSVRSSTIDALSVALVTSRKLPLGSEILNELIVPPTKSKSVFTWIEPDTVNVYPFALTVSWVRVPPLKSPKLSISNWPAALYCVSVPRLKFSWVYCPEKVSEK